MKLISVDNNAQKLTFDGDQYVTLVGATDEIYCMVYIMTTKKRLPAARLPSFVLHYTLLHPFDKLKIVLSYIAFTAGNYAKHGRLNSFCRTFSQASRVITFFHAYFSINNGQVVFHRDSSMRALFHT